MTSIVDKDPVVDSVKNEEPAKLWFAWFRVLENLQGVCSACGQTVSCKKDIPFRSHCRGWQSHDIAETKAIEWVSRYPDRGFEYDQTLPDGECP